MSLIIKSQMILGNFIRWIKAIVPWISEPRLFWLCILVVGISVYCVFLEGVSELKIRIAGMFLQLCGVATVALGVRETRKLFGYPHFFQLTLAWAKRFPKYYLRRITAEVNIAIPGIEMSVSGYTWRPADPDAPIEKRLEVIEANLSDLNARFDQAQQRLDHETRKIHSQLDEEQLLREKDDQETRKKLEAAQTGGLRISAMGLVWLSLGIIMSSTSVEIAKLIN